ncbi:MAG: hypothetical protein IPG89_03820 [Bacteroidetes bacterium]|nr:hypothetical protein [Bacteroidota bacterium]
MVYSSIWRLSCGQQEALYAPTVIANTTYYCTASSGGRTCNVGKASWTAGDGYFGTTNWGIRFNALSAFTLVSVKVYVQTAGNTVSIQLQDNTGSKYWSTSYNKCNCCRG